MDNKQGLYKKYIITKTDGTPTDIAAPYFVLRLDTDVHARKALRAYAESVAKDNIQLSHELRAWLFDTQRTEAGIKEQNGQS